MSAQERLPLNIAIRVNIMLAVVALSFAFIGVRLWYLQIIEGSAFRDKSENNRLQTVFIAPPRGFLS